MKKYKYINKINRKEYKKIYTQFRGHVIFYCDNEKDIVIRNCFGAHEEVAKYFDVIEEE